MQFEKIKGAAYWASYLINGDASGLSDQEKSLADAWCDRNGIMDVVGCEDEPHFTWHYDLHTGSDFKGGEVLEYVCLMNEAKAS